MADRAANGADRLGHSSAAARARLAAFWDPEDVAAALRAAGRVLDAVREPSAFPASFRTAWPEFARLASKGDYPGDPTVRPAVPTAAQIAEMERRMRWPVRFVRDPDRRRIVVARLQTDALSGRPKFSWATVGEQAGVTAPTAQKWHGQGCGDIARALNVHRLPVKIEL